MEALHLEEGDIVFARVKFMESDEAKIRPVLVLSIDAIGIKVACGSTQQVGSPLNHEFDVTGEYVEKVCLKKPTRFDLRKRQYLTPFTDDTSAWVHKGPKGNIRDLRAIGAHILRAYRNSGML